MYISVGYYSEWIRKYIFRFVYFPGKAQEATRNVAMGVIRTNRGASSPDNTIKMSNN
ncbi:hypothetical protein [Cohnella abietis]|uniref:hypothetical protein n=1 Tax=Cohnella abietis TaxID=2507935 RepID=UPI0013903E28|nr:hypothetical protein [Cohnella abietis]